MISWVSISRYTLYMTAKRPARPIVRMLLLRKSRFIRLTEIAIHIKLLKIPFPTNLKEVRSSFVVIAK